MMCGMLLSHRVVGSRFVSAHLGGTDMPETTLMLEADDKNPSKAAQTLDTNNTFHPKPQTVHSE